jgi:dTMP kinase
MPLITFEGTEGCGKSTQIARLKLRLEAAGIGPVILLREPGSTPLSEAIRTLIKHPPEDEGFDVEPETELLLFEAARIQLVKKKILPALAKGHWILCDRFYDSTTVYQGVARAVDPQIVATLNRFASASIEPDITFVLDVKADVGLSRAKKRASITTGPIDRMETEAIHFYEAVREGYLELAKNNTHRMFVLDAHQDLDTLERSIYDIVIKKFR